METETGKMIRVANQEKLAKDEEYRALKKEIEKLKHILDNDRLDKNREVESRRSSKSKHLMIQPKFMKQSNKLWKKFESCDCFWQVDTMFTQCTQKTMETKTDSRGAPFGVKVYVKKKETGIVDDFSQPNFCNYIERSKDEITSEEIFPDWVSSKESNKNEMMNRFFGAFSETKRITQGDKEKLKLEINILKQMNLLGKKGKETKQIISSDKADLLRESEAKYTDNCKYIENKKLEQSWKIWRNFTLVIKQKNEEKRMVESKIEAFLTRLEKRGGRENSITQKSFRDLKTANQNFKGRVKTSTLLEKKLQERRKTITENDAKKESNLQEIIKEVKNSQKESYRTLVTLDSRGKGEKSKVLKIFANVSENPNVTSTIPKFLERMEKRREERCNRWKSIREKKKKMEEEKENNRRLNEKQMKAMAVLVKTKKLQELKEKRKVEEEKREKEKKEKEKLKCQVKLADVHYRRALLQNYGLGPWLDLMHSKHLQNLQVLNFYRKKLTQHMFTRWKIVVRNEMERKEKKIKDFYHKILKKNCFRVWTKILEERITQYQAAIDLYDLKITEKIFKKWLKFTQEEQLVYLSKTEIAYLHYTKKLKDKFLKKWKDHPNIRRLENAKEERKRIWRQKVRQILPDYQPFQASGNF